MKGTSLLLHCWLAISFHFIAGWLLHFISLPISLQAGYFIFIAYFIAGWLFHCIV